MPKVRLTDRAVRNFKLPERGQVDYFDDNPRGFGVRVSQGGQRSFIVMYRFEGRFRRHTLGQYPHLSLRDARQKAKDALHEVAHGRDPGALKQSERAAETFKELADLYLEEHAKKQKRSWKEDKRILKRDLLPRWRKRRATGLTRAEIRRLLAHISNERGSPIMANRTLALIRKIYNFGISREIVQLNPCHGIERPNPERERARVLSHDELRQIWGALHALPSWFETVFKIYLLTAQREEEVLAMAKAELDVNAAWWNIPGERTKNELPHRVPLSAPAVRLLKQALADAADSPWVFPSPRKDGPRVTLQKPLRELRELSGISDFHIHDLRRTAASHMTSIGIPRQVVSRVLNHQQRDSTRVYDRYSYDKEKREALDQWASELSRIIAGDDADVPPQAGAEVTGAGASRLH